MLRTLIPTLLAALVFTAGCSSSKGGCKSDSTSCGGACVQLASDNQNCGACGNACATGSFCSAGTCTLTCGTGLVGCGGTCIDPLTDPDHCGASGACTGASAGDVCVAGETCQAGVCTVVTVPTTVDLATHQAAAVAIGQPDLVTSDAPAAGSCPAASTYLPAGAAAFDGTYLFVPDTFGNRVHAFLGVPSSSGPTPSFSLGTGAGAVPCATPGVTISGSDAGLPQSLAVAGTGPSAKLLLVDSLDNRVLAFNSLPASGSASADVAVGQVDLGSFATGCAANALDGPQGVTVAGTKLVIADTHNNRVLVWNTIPLASGTDADLVLGQSNLDGTPNFTTCSLNTDPAQTTAPFLTARTLYSPTDVWSDGSVLAVADKFNNRILLWNSFPTVSGQPADVVIGQANFTTFAAGISATQLDSPSSVAGDGTHLFVADTENNRVLGYSIVPASNGAAATIVLGQADLAHGSQNEGNGTTASATGLAFPSGLAVVGRSLVVSDTGNNRVLVFTSP
jgi:hypothetical protein